MSYIQSNLLKSRQTIIIIFMMQASTYTQVLSDSLLLNTLNNFKIGVIYASQKRIKFREFE